MEIKLDILYVFIPHMIYRYVDEVIEVFKEIVAESCQLNGIFSNNINPIMVVAQIIEIDHKIMDNFPLSKIRIEQYETNLIEKLLKLLDRLYLPQIIQKFLKQRDLEGNSVLEKLARFNQFAVL